MAIFDGSVAVEIIDFLKQTIFCTVGNNSFEMEGQSATSRQSATSMMQINMTYGTDCQHQRWTTFCFVLVYLIYGMNPAHSEFESAASIVIPT
mmetsp:Transcript_36723/g.37145  ORF Transcript_36723/g.37145 Transcript_36723/m.37145 type:complete len:93 (+) Transcript_36723:48-326(+)